MPRYVFHDGPVVIKNANKADPQKIGEAVARAERVYEQKVRSGEKLGRDDYVARLLRAEALRQKGRSPFYHIVEWDTDKAAEMYQLEQIRSIIRVIEVVDDRGEQKRAFIHVKAETEARGSYRSVETIAGNLDLQIATLRWAEKELERCRARLRDYSELFQQASDLVDRVRARRERMMLEPGASADKAA